MGGSLPVPTSLRATLRNSQGKPLTRLERSTGESYPTVLQALEADLRKRSSKAGASTTMQEAVTSAVGRLYLQVMASPHRLQTATEASESLESDQSRSAKQGTQKRTCAISTIGSQDQRSEKHEEISQLLAKELLRREGLNLQGTELQLAEKSLKKGLREAGRFGEQINAVGYLVEESEFGNELGNAATKPSPVTLKEAGEHKIKWNSLSESAIQAHEYALRAWAKIIKKNNLEDINTKKLNEFLEQLSTQGWNGKP